MLLFFIKNWSERSWWKTAFLNLVTVIYGKGKVVVVITLILVFHLQRCNLSVLVMLNFVVEIRPWNDSFIASRFFFNTSKQKFFKLFLTFSLTLQPRKSLSLQVKTDTTDFNVICGGCFYLGFQKLLKASSIHCAGCQRL